MNLNDYTYLLNHPEQVGPQQTDALDRIVSEFPYFQSARALRLKGLYNQNSFQYNYALKVAAAYTTDRSVLFDFITSDTFTAIQKGVYDKKLAENSDISVVEAVDVKPTEPDDIVEASILQSIRESENAKEIPVIAETVDAAPEPEPVVEQPIEIETASTHETIIGTQVTPIAEVETDTKTQDVLELGKPLAFSADEKHSFAEWLQLSSLKPIDRSEPEPEETATLPELESPEWQKKQALIDKFIETNPKIPAIRQDYTPPAPELPREDSSLMTETLARVYLEQKKYQKAIQAYEILILKYPEKSIFFADRISEIKKLQQNN